MSAYGDPTPCPPPRMSAHDKVGAWLDANAPTEEVTVAGIPIVKTGNRMIDARPRRPGRAISKKNVGFEILDEENDTFAFHTSVRPPAPTPANEAMTHSLGASVRAAPRRSSMFLPPASRPSLDTSRDNDLVPRKRRISVIAEDGADSTIALPDATTNFTLAHIPEHKSTIRREPRRRTVYIPPDDTTVMTIHPGHAASAAQPRRPRRSDVFLDLADVPEGNPEPLLRPARHLPRASLSGAPRRAPLGRSARQSLAPNAQLGDMAGSGGGKENLPPGRTMDAKRLGKRASLMIPSIQEQPHRTDSIMQPTSQSQDMLPPPPQTHPSYMGPLVPGQSGSSQLVAARRETMGASGMMSTAAMANSRRRSLAPALLAQSRRQSQLLKLPESLAAPSLLSKGKTLAPRYSVIAEDVATPELYEDNWISHQETAMAQLINSLFVSVGHDTHGRGPRDRGLRRDLLNIHQDPSNALLHKRLQASLQFGALCMPQDMLQQVARIRVDIGQRQRFLDLWMKTYNRSALQAAAEVVLAREIGVSPRTSDYSGSDSTAATDRASSKAISAFLQTFLVENADVATGRLSLIASAIETSAMDGSGGKGIAWGWRRTVLRSLMLILLLDRAKNAGVFRGCLFQTSSPCKSSHSIVQALAKILIPSIGDIQRVLSHLNYCVSYTQYPLQEYTYQTSNLATDLRDGIRLTRLVETLLYPPASLALRNADEDITVSMPAGDILTCALNTQPQSQSWVLSQHLKYPCCGRSQKVFNVQIALSALSGVKEVSHLLAGIKAEDIVDGHREKTIGLLWALVSRWGMEVLVDFEALQREISRLSKAYRLLTIRQRQKQPKPIFEVDEAAENAEAAEIQYLQGEEKHKRLLQLWARNVGRLHGLRVENLSTAFADGCVWEAMLKEYACAIGVEKSTSPASSAQSSVAQKLRALGCSQAFISLFPPIAGASSSIGSNLSKLNNHGLAMNIPTSKTTIPLLAFLASRLLPAAQPHIAAATIQRAWRNAMTRDMVRRRLVCARLARDCAMVVQYRERIEWAARVIQRKWKVVCWK
ncbi:hypothetical protein FH972_025504 [Carpinus fangiana]|uniref:Calponin-homology (CH) domain-containing protein n=1 Tax=Carpinus fangiana TaxID=176857 RepID=A0A5N6L1M3_9ROSI|nr:hypothetical protein FH972_025504 [Carpinus fangiana]